MLSSKVGLVISKDGASVLKRLSKFVSKLGRVVHLSSEVGRVGFRSR